MIGIKDNQHGPISMRNAIKKHGSEKISEIRVCRQPVMSIATKLANIATLGELNKKVKDLGYDNVFHLFLKIRLSNGLSYRVEKNQRVTVTRTSSSCKESLMPLNFNPNLTFAEFLNNTLKHMGNSFFVYTVDKFNCQHFVLKALEANRIKVSSKQKYWIKQDVTSIMKHHPILNKIVNGLAHLAKQGDILLHGNGAKPRKPKAKSKPKRKLKKAP